jgi:hypothetical protein
MSDTLIWIILLFVFLIIIGLYCTKFTPLDLTEKQKILNLNDTIENFVSSQKSDASSHKSSNNIEHFSSTSSDTERSDGASHHYNWGLPDTNIYNFDDKPKCKPEHKCDDKCPRTCPLFCNKEDNCTPRPKDTNINEVCRKCDITLNHDIDKYVLKSSVPACPDTSEFVTKNMINAHPDLSEYILKSEIKPCPNVNLSEYILKSSVPPCPDCPTCPECPICPVCPTCPPEKQCKNIYEYSISEHPDYDKYISKQDLEKNYIKKSEHTEFRNKISDFLNKIKNKLFGEYKEQKNKLSDLKDKIEEKIKDKSNDKSNDESNNKLNNSDNDDYLKNKLKDNLKDNLNDNLKKNLNNSDNDDKKYNPNRPPKTPYDDDLNIFDNNYHSELLSDNIQGYYAGDSAFAGV